MLIPPHSFAEEADTPSPAPRSLRVLVAEDNQVNQQLVVRLLLNRGHSVVLVGNGREAIAAYERGSFDVILMDLQMPDIGGFEAAAAIRAHGDGHRSPPIIAMTTGTTKDDREACLAAGMDGYIAKPLSPKALYDQIETLARTGGPQADGLSLDGKALLDHFGGDHGLLTALATIFLEDCPARLSAIQAGVERRDAAALREAAHALRGSVANFGAVQAVEAALKLELMGQAGDLKEAPAALLLLQQAMAAFIGDLGTITRQQ